MRLLGTVLLTLTLAACANDKNSNPATVNAPTAVDLSEKSTKEVLEIKYTKAILNCNLWTQFGPQLDIEQTPNDTFVIDLKTNEGAMSFDLVGIANGRTTRVNIVLQAMHVIDALEVKNNSEVYELKQSPMAVIHFVNQQSASYHQGNVAWTSGSMSLFEKIEATPVDTALGSAGSDRYFSRVVCTLETEVRHEYQDQWQQIR